MFEQIRDDVAAEPGVRSVSLAEVALMTDSNNSSTVKVDGYEAKDGEDMNPNFNAVAPGFFETMGITRVAGREFTDADGPGAPHVAVVNETFVRYFFGDKDPLGRRFGRGGATRSRVHDRGAWSRTARRPPCARSRSGTSTCPTGRRRWSAP